MSSRSTPPRLDRHWHCGGRDPSPALRPRRGSRSERGTRVAALFYSLIEAAKLAGVEPRAYLRKATLRAVRNPGSVTLARNLEYSESRGKPALDRLGAKTPESPRTCAHVRLFVHEKGQYGVAQAPGAE